MPAFFDTHAHLDYPDFAPDIGQVIARAQAAGIVKIISIGTDLQAVPALSSWPRPTPKSTPSSAGIRPTPSTRRPTSARPCVCWHGIPRLWRSAKLVYYRLPSAKGGTPADDDAYRRRQAGLFQQHLDVAAETGLNCVIHQRGDCFADTLAQLQPFADRVRGVFHCFANDAAALQQVLAIGSLVSFTGIVTFKNGQNVRDTVAATPLGQFMLETDCPYLAPVPYRGQRCEPAYVKDISKRSPGSKVVPWRNSVSRRAGRRTALLKNGHSLAAGHFLSLIFAAFSLSLYPLSLNQNHIMAYQDVTPPSGGKISIQAGKLNVPENPIIPFIRGDGTGPDMGRERARIRCGCAKSLRRPAQNLVV